MCQITAIVLLKNTSSMEKFRPVYFNSVTKTVTNQRFKLEDSFQEILYMIGVWINNGSVWIIELIESQYINISNYRTLPGSSYMNLPVELRSPRKGLISIKNKDRKCFSWCHVRHINPSKEHPEGIKNNNKNISEKFDYDEVEFLVKEKDFNKIEAKNKICINVFGFEIKLVFSIYVSDKKFEDSIDLLLLIDNDKSHYVYLKHFNRFMFQKTKNKKWFCKSCLQ